MRWLAFLFLVSSFVFVSLSNQTRAQTPVDVFFIAGQSNAAGRITANPDDFEEENFAAIALNKNDPLVQYFYNTDGPASVDDQTSSQAFTTLQPLPDTGYYGPEIAAGRELVELGYNPVIIKITEGGTNLSNDWNSRDFDADRGELWRRWVTEVNVALSLLEAQGEVRLRGFLWLQGESDSGQNSGGQARNYERRFRSLVDDFYGVLGDGAVEGQSPTGSGSEFDGAFIPSGATNGLGFDTSELVFVTALIHPRVSPEGLANFENGVEPFNITNRITVRNAQIAVSDEDPNRTFFETVDLDPNDPTTNNNGNAANDLDGVPGASGLQSDGTHFNPVANRQIGLRFAAAIGPNPGPEVLLGDCNQDGVVNFQDIAPFISILSAGGFRAEADINGDGVVDFADISPFISILAS